MGVRGWAGGRSVAAVGGARAGWYTSYTPYQAEISQGRLESLLNFQTMVCDLTGLFMANASLLDEATAAAEAMNLVHGQHGGKRGKFFVAADVHPQNLECVRTRASGMGIEVVVGDPAAVDFGATTEFSGVLLQYPNTYGGADAAGIQAIVARAHASKTLVITATDLLALTLLKSPGELGVDIAVGSAQRFGVPMGFGGPHAGFLATGKGYERRLPGRIIGVSKDAQGNRALRMAMQTREQHIRRDKATSNICTAQALLANMAAMYACYHGPEGLTAIAKRCAALAGGVGAMLRDAGYAVHGGKPGVPVFDTITVECARGSPHSCAAALIAECELEGLNVRRTSETAVGISFDEKTTADHVLRLLRAHGAPTTLAAVEAAVGAALAAPLPAATARATPFLTHPVFNSHRSEHQLLRYIHSLEMKDLSLNYSMIALGSCTMKLNASAEMAPVTWPQFADVHPFAPAEQTNGYATMMAGLNDALIKITGFAAASLQPNSGAAGEYAGLMAIRAYQQARGQGHRDVCLIPVSAHGTNPASAVMAGMRVVVVASDEAGNVDMADLKAKAAQHKDALAALMITYPSTYGVFEEGAREFCELVHGYGGQVYMDGANMNAQVALTSPGTIGADVCHLNLHKTFCIPHGGGGPGVGAICVAEHLAPHLPGHPVVPTGGYGKSASVARPAPLALVVPPERRPLVRQRVDSPRGGCGAPPPHPPPPPPPPPPATRPQTSCPRPRSPWRRRPLARRSSRPSRGCTSPCWARAGSRPPPASPSSTPTTWRRGWRPTTPSRSRPPTARSRTSSSSTCAASRPPRAARWARRTSPSG